MLSAIGNFKSVLVLALIAGLLITGTPGIAQADAGPGGKPPVRESDDEPILDPNDIPESDVSFKSAPAVKIKNLAPVFGKAKAAVKSSVTASIVRKSADKARVSEQLEIKKEPQVLSAHSSMPSGIREGMLKDYSIHCQGRVFTFREKPLSSIDGKIYICASDPDFKAMFESLGLTYSWFSYSGKLFIYLPWGSITWNVKEKTALMGDTPVTVPLTARSAFSGDYIPLDSIAALLDLKVIQKNQAFEIRPGIKIDGIAEAEDGTIDIRLQSATEIKYQAKYQARPPAVRMTVPKTAYNGKTNKFFVEGVQVRINDTVDPNNLFITFEFPPHWKGRIEQGAHKNLMSIRMMPNLVYAYGTKDQLLQSIEAEKTKDQLYLLFKATGQVQYYWSFDPDEGVLYVDIPFSTPERNLCLKGNTNQLVKNCSISTLRPDGVNITRLKIELAKGAAFMIGPPEEQKANSFALLLGPKDAISSPSPRMGGSTVTIADGTGSGNLIVIDPGHGGSDPGACNRELGIREKDLTLDISKKMANVLNRMGYKVILTRYTDTDVTYPGSPDADELMARCDAANSSNAELFVSIHCNASTSKKLRGSSYHWYKSKDREVAHALDGSLGANINTVEKGPRRDEFFVLKHTKAPSVLVECAFMSNPEDIRILADENYRAKIALQLARSLDVWLRNKNLARTNKAGGASEE